MSSCALSAVRGINFFPVVGTSSDPNAPEPLCGGRNAALPWTLVQYKDYGLRRCYHRVLAPLYTHAMFWAALRRHRVHAEPGTGPLPQRQPSFSYPFLLTVLDPLPSRVKPIRHYTLRSDRNNTPRCLS